MLPVLDYLLLCCVDFENKISIYLSVTFLMVEITTWIPCNKSHIHVIIDKLHLDLSWCNIF